jgi:hypothetical protein
MSEAYAWCVTEAPRLRVTGWGPVRLWGERRRQERASAAVREMMSADVQSSASVPVPPPTGTANQSGAAPSAGEASPAPLFMPSEPDALWWAAHVDAAATRASATTKRGGAVNSPSVEVGETTEGLGRVRSDLSGGNLLFPGSRLYMSLSQGVDLFSSTASLMHGPMAKSSLRILHGDFSHDVPMRIRYALKETSTTDALNISSEIRALADGAILRINRGEAPERVIADLHTDLIVLLGNARESQSQLPTTGGEFPP